MKYKRQEHRFLPFFFRRITMSKGVHSMTERAIRLTDFASCAG